MPDLQSRPTSAFGREAELPHFYPTGEPASLNLSGAFYACLPILFLTPRTCLELPCGQCPTYTHTVTDAGAPTHRLYTPILPASQQPTQPPPPPRACTSDLPRVSKHEFFIPCTPTSSMRVCQHHRRAQAFACSRMLRLHSYSPEPF